MSAELNAKIVASPVFKALNTLIDERVASLDHYHFIIGDRMGRLVAGEVAHGRTPRVNTRVSYEDPKEHGEHDLKFNNRDLKDIAEMIVLALADETAIGDLQRFKLRLLNDYDFTHGDDELQRLIFGEEKAPE